MMTDEYNQNVVSEGNEKGGSTEKNKASGNREIKNYLTNTTVDPVGSQLPSNIPSMRNEVFSNEKKNLVSS